MVFVVRRHQRPGDEVAAGPVHHVAHGLLVVGPALAVAPVLVGNLVMLEAGLFAHLEAFKLFVGADREPELQHHDAVVRELRLEFVDFVVGA